MYASATLETSLSLMRLESDLVDALLNNPGRAELNRSSWSADEQRGSWASFWRPVAIPDSYAKG